MKIVPVSDLGRFQTIAHHRNEPPSYLHRQDSVQVTVVSRVVTRVNKAYRKYGLKAHCMGSVTTAETSVCSMKGLHVTLCMPKA